MQIPRPVSLTSQTIILLLLFSNSVVFSSDLTFPVPDGWRLPTVQEADNWYRKGMDKFLSVAGDFNGDSRRDVAKLLIRKDDSIVGLFALMSEELDESRLILIVTTGIQSGIKRVGIEKVKPGSYPTACGKGYWGCKEDEPPILKIQFEAINFFAFESAARYYYWEPDRNKFVGIQKSD